MTKGFVEQPLALPGSGKHPLPEVGKIKINMDPPIKNFLTLPKNNFFLELKKRKKEIIEN